MLLSAIASLLEWKYASTTWQFLPQFLIILRFLLTPLLIRDAWDGKTSFFFLVAYLTAFFSDIFDGIIARRLGISTAKLRQADSWADVCLYLGITVCVWRVQPQVFTQFQTPLLVLLMVQLIWWFVNLLKYGQPASYHTYSAKIWGITLLLATIALFGFHYTGIFLWLAILVGIFHTIEEIAMTLILPHWTHDVLSLSHAWQLRV